MRPIITLTTDFGEGSRYVAAMKGVILSINPEATIVDISHSVAPQDIAAGVRVLEEATPWFPAGAIHVAVIDPGVGGSRRIALVEREGQRYVAPDNGLLGWLASGAGASKMVAIENPALRLECVSSTFHGRDIMAPAAAHLSLGIDSNQLGPPLERLVQLQRPEVRRVAQRIEGQVVEVDSFGNLITDITADMLVEAPRDESLNITCDEHETMGLFQTYSDQPPMTLMALLGSSGRMELAIVNDSAAMMLGVTAGAPVVVKWG